MNFMKIITITMVLTAASIFWVILLYVTDPNHPERRGETHTVRIDGCQYLKNYTSRHRFVLTHKGSCDNPVHSK